MSQEPIHYSIFGADIQNYSGRRPLGQLELRRLLSAALDEAAGQSAAGRPRWVRQDQGDGELALVPATVSKPVLVAELIRELRVALDLLNEARNPADRLRLRVAMHYGEVHVDGTGFAGAAPVVASRLLDARELRQALDGEPDANLALILSMPMFEAVNGYRDIRQRDFTPVPVKVKGFQHDAWVGVPGFPPPKFQSADAEPDGSGSEAVVGHPGGPVDSSSTKDAKSWRRTHGRIVIQGIQGPVSLGDGPVAGRDINYYGKQ